MTGTRFVYVARPIDQAGTDARASRWAEEAYERLSQAGLGAFTPDRAFRVPEGARASGYIERVNRAALAASSGVIALLPAGVPTVGVPMEIEAATHLGIPVAVITDGPTWSLTDRPGVGVFDLHSSHAMTGAFADAVAHLVLNPVVRTEKRELSFKLAKDGTLPTRAYESDAGFDLYVSKQTAIFSEDFKDVPLGVDGVELPDDTWGLITGRSSAIRGGLLVTQGVIDTGYRGPLFAGVRNLSGSLRVLEPGERVAQLVLHTNVALRYEPVAVDRELAASDRGTRGFGSSGT